VKPTQPDKKRPSRRRFLGGSLAVTLAAVLLPADRPISRPLPYTGKARWIGHW
jgi:hypothetical protein